jgi:RNA recognition motif-containing protein
MQSMVAPYGRVGGGGGVRQLPQAGNNNCVYVGNLSWNVDWKDLKDLFKEVGHVVRADVLTEPITGRSKGCGTVEFQNAAAAQRAIDSLNDMILKGRPIFVREDRERSQDHGYRGNENTYKRSPLTIGRRVYVGNLAWGVVWQDLKDHFKQAGNVTRADVMTERGASGGRSLGCGIVEFSTPEEAQVAISSLNDTELKGRLIFVREDREQTDKHQGKPLPKESKGNPKAVFVGQLDGSVTQEDLTGLFSSIGTLLDVNITGRGYAIVTYESPAMAALAIEKLNHSELRGRAILVREDKG